MPAAICSQASDVVKMSPEIALSPLASTHLMAEIQYRPEIDGLRAVAVIPVILFHLGYGWISGGYLGVDVFFVISGFLITSILNHELKSNSFTFRGFWTRRIRRILPALTTVILVTVAVGFFCAFKPNLQSLGKQAVAAFSCVANIFFWRTSGDYWGRRAEESPLLHTWSLSVEEQFYFFYPVAMYLLFRYFRSLIALFLSGVVIFSLATYLWGVSSAPTSTFYLLPTRAWELATGCILALAPRIGRTEDSKGVFDCLAVVGLAMVLMAYRFLPDLNGGLAIAVLGAAFIIAFGQSGPCHAILARREFVHIGKISYSLYLWHWPVTMFNKELSWGLDRPVLLLPILLLSELTYRFVEQPFRRKAGGVPTILSYAFVVLLFAIGLAAVPLRYDTSGFAEARWTPYNCHPHLFNLTGAMDDKMATTVVDYSNYRPEAYLEGGIIVPGKSAAPEIVVLGDSHGCMWSTAIATVTQEQAITTSFYCIDGVEPFLQIPPTGDAPAYGMTKEEKLRFDESRLHFIREWKPKLLIIGAAWDDKHLHDAVDLLSFAAGQEIKVVLVEDPPQLRSGQDNVMQWLAWHRFVPAEGKRQYVPSYPLAINEGGRRVVRELARRFKNVSVLESYDLYDAEICALALDGRSVVYLDDDHVLSYGANFIVPRLREKISTILGPTSTNEAPKAPGDNN